MSPSQPRIFISYRRGDTSGHALLVRNGLEDHFGPGHVFMDIATIAPGRDFTEAIAEGVGSSDVLLALIGRDWLSSVDEDGRRRLDDPEDFVATEIRSAIERGVRVIPLLVGGAAMPRSQELPDGLRRLARLQAFEMSDGRWSYDLRRLIESVDEEASPAPQPSPTASPSRRPERAEAAAGHPDTATSPPPAATGVAAAAGIVMASGAVIAAGGLLPWVRSTHEWPGGSTLTRIGFAVHNNLGVVTSIAGVVLMVIAVTVLRQRYITGVQNIAWIGAAGAVVVLAARKLSNAGQYDAIDLEPLFGLFVVLAAGIVAAVAAAVPAGARLVQGRPRRQHLGVGAPSK